MLRNKCALVVVLFCLAPSARAATIPGEYDKLIQHRGEITAFGSEGFGDRIDIGSGDLEIVQTDVDLPGNNALPVRIARRFTPGNKYASGHFGVWNLDIPYVHGVFSNYNHYGNPVGWTVDGSGGDIYKRCSQFSAPPFIHFQISVFEADEYWHGSFFHLPGGGEQELLYGGHVPSDGNAYSVTTKNGAAVRCVALAATSSGQGEGFEVVTPDGTVYTLNQMVERTEASISKPAGSVTLLTTANAYNAAAANAVVESLAATTFHLSRNEVILYPTKVTDRFGNSVTYTWSATNPWQLLQITASDGRQITLTYPDASSRQVSSVSDGTRTWTYSGTSSAYTVTQPDGSKWLSNLTDLFTYSLIPPIPSETNCDTEQTTAGAAATGTITAPTGATVVFTMVPVKLGRSWAPRECISDDDGNVLYAREPRVYFNLAITGKKITGPGLPATGLSWTHAYGAPNGCWAVTGIGNACTSSSPTSRTVTVTAPDGDATRYTFGNQFAVNEGLLLKVESGWNGTSALRTVETTYADMYAVPYHAYSGSSPRGRGDAVVSGKKHPQRKVTTTQQGRSFTWEVAADCSGMPYCFDTYARPTKVIRSSSP
ncbi:MAG: hypothetical protein QM599_10095 [Pseudoxanthomonas sp.]